MTTFTAVLLAAALAFGLSKLLRLPVIPLLILSGVGLRVLAGQTALELPESFLSEMVQLGIAVLVFTAGIDLSPRRMRGRTRPIITVALVQFFFLGAVGVLTGIHLGYGLTTALYLGCALSASSTLVVVRHLQSRRQMFEPFGRLVLGVLLLQDLFIVLLLVVLQTVPDGWTACLLAILQTGALGTLAYAVHRWGVPWVTRHLRLDEEELMLGALATLFAFSGLAHLLDLPYLVGAFFAGFALSAFPMNGLVRGMLGSLSGFFLALFFICIGALLSWPGLEALIHCLILIAVLIAVTVILVSAIAEAVGYSTRASIEAGLLLSQTSEFSLIIALAGLASGQIEVELFSMIALITVGTMTLTPLLSREPVAWALMKLHPRYRRGETDCRNLSNHAVLLGYGRAGPRTTAYLRKLGCDVVVIDDDAGVIRKLIERGISCIQGDGSDPRILERANARQARVVLCSMRRTRDAQVALEHLRGSPAKVFVRTFEPEELEQVQAAGGIPVRIAHASTDIFLSWLDENLPQGAAAAGGSSP